MVWEIHAHLMGDGPALTIPRTFAIVGTVITDLASCIVYFTNPFTVYFFPVRAIRTFVVATAAKVTFACSDVSYPVGYNLFLLHNLAKSSSVQPGTGQNFSTSHLRGFFCLLQLPPHSRSFTFFLVRLTSFPLFCHGKLKSPPCVLNICAYQVLWLHRTLPPDNQVLTATSIPWFPQLPSFSSLSSNSQNFSLVHMKQDPCKLMVSVKPSFLPFLYSGLPLYSLKYWK